MKEKFCPKCGKKTEKLIDSICEECFQKSNSLISIPEIIKIEICKNCGKIKDKKWKRGRSIKELIKERIEVNGKLEELKIEEDGGKGKETIFKIKAKGLLKGKVGKEERKKTKIKIKEKLCENCGKVKGGYYEAIIQLRSGDEKKIKKSMKKIIKILENNNGYLTKMENRKNGVDMYMAPKSLADKIIRNIAHKEKKKSFSIAGKKDGKDLYRLSLLLRL